MEYFDKYADIQSDIEIAMHRYTSDCGIYVMLSKLSNAVSCLYYDMDMCNYDEAAHLLIKLKNAGSHDKYSELNSLMTIVQIDLHELLLSLFAI